MKLVIASRNEKKLKEIQLLLQGMDIDIRTLRDYPHIPEVLEDGNTFDANALKKAKVVASYTKELTLADDSGLEVECLNGEPGIFSSRFAHENATDDENNQKLLAMLNGVPEPKRIAAFHCSIVIVCRERHYFAQGRCEGHISTEIRGREGFGYDPLFVLSGYKKTFAEIGSEKKNRVSHRTKALFEAKKIITEIMNERNMSA